MTTIIAMHTADDFAIYTDSLVQYGSIAVAGGTKFFYFPGVLVGGWCGSLQGGTRIVAELQDLFDAGRLVDFFRHPGHHDSIRVSEADQRDFEMLLLYNHQIWLLHEDLVPIAVPLRYLAKGSGAMFALGALEAGASPWRALAIASHYDIGSRGPFFRCDLDGKIDRYPSPLEE